MHAGNPSGELRDPVAHISARCGHPVGIQRKAQLLGRKTVHQIFDDPDRLLIARNGNFLKFKIVIVVHEPFSRRRDFLRRLLKVLHKIADPLRRTIFVRHCAKSDVVAAQNIVLLDEPVRAVERHAAVIADNAPPAVSIGQTGDDAGVAHLAHILAVDAENAVVVRRSVFKFILDLFGKFVSVRLARRARHADAAEGIDAPDERRARLAADDQFQIYDHIPGNLETTTAIATTVPKDTILPVSSKVQDDAIAGLWYVCTYQDKTYYCQDLANSDIVYIYDELPVDSHLFISAKIDNVKAYLYADKNCPGFSILPIDEEYKPEAYIENISSVNWYKITYNDTIMYVCDDSRELKKTMKYAEEDAVEGSFILAKSNAFGYRYPGATLEEDRYLLDPGKRYEATRIITEEVDGRPWYQIKFPNTFSIANIDFDADIGEIIDELPDDPDVEFPFDEIFGALRAKDEILIYCPIDDLHELVYWYPNTECDPDTYLEVLTDNFYYFNSPVSEEGKELLPIGRYSAKEKLNQRYGEKTWFVIDYNGEEVFAPLIEDQSRIIVDGSQEKIIQKMKAIMTELKGIRQEIDDTIPVAIDMTTRIMKSKTKLRTLELRLYTLQLYYWYFFSEGGDKPKPITYDHI